MSPDFERQQFMLYLRDLRAIQARSPQTFQEASILVYAEMYVINQMRISLHFWPMA